MAFSDFDLPTLAAQFTAWGHPVSAAIKVLRRYYETGGQSIDGPQIARVLRARLDAEIPLRATTIAARRQAADGTIKLLISLAQAPPARLSILSDAPPSASTVECVLMPSHRPERSAGCVSSQIGCAMGCDFCASTKSGVERSLTAGEIIEQFLWLRTESLLLNRKLQTLVFMGMGEPLLNYDNVLAAIRRIGVPELGSLGWRQITVSTVGIIPGIDRLADEGIPLTLAVSLHAPDDDTRSAIVPTGRKFRVADILAAARRYQAKVGRPVNIEYTMLEGVNDSDAQARLLAELIATDDRAGRVHVNLIPYNYIGPGVSGKIYQQPTAERMARFAEILGEGGAIVHFRRTRGDDIEGACGQLRETVATRSDG